MKRKNVSDIHTRQKIGKRGNRLKINISINISLKKSYYYKKTLKKVNYWT